MKRSEPGADFSCQIGEEIIDRCSEQPNAYHDHQSDQSHQERVLNCCCPRITVKMRGATCEPISYLEHCPHVTHPFIRTYLQCLRVHDWSNRAVCPEYKP